MDPVLLRRFVKYNKSLVGVIGVSVLVVLFLLVVAVLKYLEMVEANNEVNRMRNTIRDLQDPLQNQVSVIEGNLKLLNDDLVVYSEKNQLIRPFFGHPYRVAVNVMALNLGLKNGDELIKKFYDFLNENQHERINDRFKRFKMEFGNKWPAASNAFATEAQKVSFETINAGNVDDIFLQAIGLPREMSGRTVEHCREILKANEIKLNKIVLDKNIDVNKEASEFSLMSLGLATPQQIADSMQNMEIVGDMISRIIKALPEEKTVRVVDRVKFISKTPYSEDNRITVYKYNIKLVATMDALRRIMSSFNRSIMDSRVYIVRDLRLRVPAYEDKAAVVIGLVAEEIPVDKDGKKIEIKFKDDSHLPYQQRRDYGKVLIGNNPFFEIELEVDYLILKQHEYQRR